MSAEREKLFAVFVRCSDFCGNSDTYGPVGYVHGDDDQSVLKAIRSPYDVIVEEVQIDSPSHVRQVIDKGIKSGKYR